MLKFMITLGLLFNFTDAFGMDDPRHQRPATGYGHRDARPAGGSVGFDSRKSDWTDSDLGEFDLDDAEGADPSVDSNSYVDPYSADHQPVWDDEQMPVPPKSFLPRAVDHAYGEDEEADDDFSAPRMTMDAWTRGFPDRPVLTSVASQVIEGKTLFMRLTERNVALRRQVEALFPRQKTDLYMVLPDLLKQFAEDSIGTTKPWVIRNCVDLLNHGRMRLPQFLDIFEEFAPDTLPSINRAQIMQALVKAVNAGVDLNNLSRNSGMDPRDLIKTINQFTSAVRDDAEEDD